MKKAIIITVSVVVLLALLRSYIYPYDIEKSYTASTVEGETIEVVLELKVYRKLLSPSQVEGSIHIDGVTYSNLRIQESTKESFLNRFKSKMRGEMDKMTFKKVHNTSLEIIYISWADPQFEKVFFFIPDKSNGFFAPAQNAKEAEQLEKIIYAEMLG